ncbi:MAG TPA: hypothetical protein DHU65_03985 [Clostridiales bacterium]|nr:hypothetical protein [Clostridiales bacterium]
MKIPFYDLKNRKFDYNFYKTGLPEEKLNNDPRILLKALIYAAFSFTVIFYNTCIAETQPFYNETFSETSLNVYVRFDGLAYLIFIILQNFVNFN